MQLRQEIPALALHRAQDRRVRSARLGGALEPKQRLHAQREVAVRSGGTLEEVPLLQQRRQPAGERRGAKLCRAQQHMRGTRVRAKRGHAAAVRRDGAAGIQRAELAQQRSALRVRRGGRRVQ